MPEIGPKPLNKTTFITDHNYTEVEQTTWTDGTVTTRRRTRELVSAPWGQWVND